MIGVDCAARTLAVVDLTEMRFHKLVVPKTDRGRELESLSHLLREQAFSGIAWVEAPVLAGRLNVQSTIKIAQTTGVVHAVLATSYEVSPSSWKSRTIGKGNADKSAVRAWLESHHPAIASRCGGDQDLVDAACIALYGHSVAAAVDAGGLVPGER